MAVTINRSRSDSAPVQSFHTLGGTLTATDAADGVGVIILDPDIDTVTRVQVVPASSGTTPTVVTTYSVVDSPTSSQFVQLGSEAGLDQAEDIAVSPTARVLKFGGENGKAGGQFVLSSSSPIDYIHTGQTVSLTPATQTITVAVGESEIVSITPSHNTKLFTWASSVTAGDTNVSASEVKFSHDYGPYVEITRSSAGAATVKITATPHSGGTAVTSTYTVN